MADHSLKSATDRRLGGPLPHQPANQTRVHHTPINLFRPCHAALSGYAVLAAVSSCYPPVYGRLPTRYSPVRHSVTKFFLPKESESGASFDLHVLSTPPAFILSQDQTLKKSLIPFRLKLGFISEIHLLNKGASFIQDAVRVSKPKFQNEFIL